MTNLINTTFKKNNETYSIFGVTDLAKWKNICKELIANGKDTFHYHAGKVLKNGTVSEKQIMTFLRFSKTGNMITAY